MGAFEPDLDKCEKVPPHSRCRDTLETALGLSVVVVVVLVVIALCVCMVHLS